MSQQEMNACNFPFWVPGACWLRRKLHSSPIDVRKQCEELLMMMTEQGCEAGDSGDRPLRCKCEDRSLSLQQLHRVEGGGLLLQSQCWEDRDWRDLGAL